jgi:outer membrane protein assembly factor BamB
MKFSKKKTITFMITLFLIMTIAIPLLNLQVVSAHSPPWVIPTWTYIAVSPHLVGIGQQLLVVMFSNTVPPTAGGAYGDRFTFYVDVTKPDETIQTLGPITSDPVGAGYTTYVPDQAGTYTFVARMVNDTITGLPLNPYIVTQPGAAYVNDTYVGSTSDPTTITVQTDPIEGWKETPLPTEYWTRPINSANRGWWQVTGNWLGGSGQTWSAAIPLAGQTTRFSYGQAPESAHIIWTKPYFAGGIMDARFNDTGYMTGHYAGLSFTPIIIQGKLYYEARNTAQTIQGYYAVDLYTGETLSLDNKTMPAFGSIYNYESPNQHGGFSYLWRTAGVTLPSGYTSRSGTQTWEMLDGFTGNTVTLIANVSAGGSAVNGKDGSILRYNFVTSGGKQYLQVWNSSAMPTMLLGTGGTDLWQWRPERLPVHNGDTAFSLNVTITKAVQGSIRAVLEDEYIIGGTSGVNKEGQPLVLGNMWKLSLKPGQEGQLIWNYTFTPPFDVAPIETYSSMYRGAVFGPFVAPEDGVFYYTNSLTKELWGFDLETGNKLWGPTNPEPDFQYYGIYNYVYQGKILTFGYSGVMFAYDIKTGEVLWNYTAAGVGYESPYGDYPIYAFCVADGKIYTVAGEHSPTQPLFRGQNLRCIDAETGKEIFKTLFYGAGVGGGHLTSTTAVIADGFILGLNFFDAQIYSFGKGPSATIVTASPKVSAHGNKVLIEGRVTDVSPGTTQLEQDLRFPNGVPAMSDEDMSAWMEYVYMQQAKPSDSKGVEVVLSVLDPNNNYYEVGNTTSDGSGTFSYAFTPEVPGKYTVIATFAGSKSYWPSNAETAIYVDEAPSSTPAPTPAPATMTDTYVLGIGAAAIIAIVVIGLVIILMLRKRP